MHAVPPNQQQALVERLSKMCGGAYSPETRRKYFISGPQWAAAYQGQALFYAPTRKPITYEDVIRELGKIGVGYWTTHDSDVIPSEHLGSDRQKEIIGNIQKTLKSNDVKCSMVTTETFYHEVLQQGRRRSPLRFASTPRFECATPSISGTNWARLTQSTGPDRWDISRRELSKKRKP